MSITQSQIHFSNRVLKDPALCEVYRRLGAVSLVPFNQDWVNEPSVTAVRSFAETQHDDYVMALTRLNVGFHLGVTSGKTCCFLFPENDMKAFLTLNPMSAQTAILQAGAQLFAFYRVDRFCPQSQVFGPDWYCGGWCSNREFIPLINRLSPFPRLGWLTDFKSMEVKFGEFILPGIIQEFLGPQLVAQEFGRPVIVNARGKAEMNPYYWAALYMRHRPLLFDVDANYFHTQKGPGVRTMLPLEVLRSNLVQFILGENVFRRPFMKHFPTSHELRLILSALRDLGACAAQKAIT